MFFWSWVYHKKWRVPVHMQYITHIIGLPMRWKTALAGHCKYIVQQIVPFRWGYRPLKYMGRFVMDVSDKVLDYCSICSNPMQPIQHWVCWAGQTRIIGEVGGVRSCLSWHHSIITLKSCQELGVIFQPKKAWPITEDITSMKKF